MNIQDVANEIIGGMYVKVKKQGNEVTHEVQIRRQDGCGFIIGGTDFNALVKKGIITGMGADEVNDNGPMLIPFDVIHGVEAGPLDYTIILK